MADYIQTHPSGMTDADGDDISGAPNPAGAVAAAQHRMEASNAQIQGQGSQLGDYMKMLPAADTSTPPSQTEMTPFEPEPFQGL